MAELFPPCPARPVDCVPALFAPGGLFWYHGHLVAALWIRPVNGLHMRRQFCVSQEDFQAAGAVRQRLDPGPRPGPSRRHTTG